MPNARLNPLALLGQKQTILLTNALFTQRPIHTEPYSHRTFDERGPGRLKAELRTCAPDAAEAAHETT